MERPTSEQLSALEAFIQDGRLIEQGKPLVDEYYYSALPLCVVDAVFSIGVRYEGVQATAARTAAWLGIERFRRDRTRQSRGAISMSNFLARVDGISPDELSLSVFRNRQRTSPRGGILKSQAVVMFSKALIGAGIDDFGHMDDESQLEMAETFVRGIPGQRSGISFDYFCMLAGDDFQVKADRMIIRFVARALGMEERTVTPAYAAAAIVRVSERLGIAPRHLDYLIWDHQRAFKNGLKEPKSP